MTACSCTWYRYLPADLRAPMHRALLTGDVLSTSPSQPGPAAQSCYSFLCSERELTQGISDSAPLPGDVYCKTPPHWLCSSVLIIRSETVSKSSSSQVFSKCAFTLFSLFPYKKVSGGLTLPRGAAGSVAGWGQQKGSGPTQGC